MRWHVNRNGETGGPFDEEQIVGWFRSGQIGRESYVQPETGGAWLPIGSAPFILHQHGSSKGSTRSKTIGYGIVALLVSASIVGALMADAPPPPEPVEEEEPVEYQAQREPQKDRVCALNAEQLDGIVPVFLTEEGLDEFVRAAVDNDADGMLLAIRANGFVVDPGTRCRWLDRGFARTKVRVAEGSHRGRAGWVPSEWSMGREE